jgi:DASH complex subunit DAD2
MSRESTYPSQSTASAPQQNIDINNLPPTYTILLQKQQEYAGLQAFKEASNEMLQRIEKLAEMSNVMADGGEGGSTVIYLDNAACVKRM